MKKSRRTRKNRANDLVVKLEMPSRKEEQTEGFPEYQYVVADLKRVAILAAAMFALLIALSFFIR